MQQVLEPARKVSGTVEGGELGRAVRAPGAGTCKEAVQTPEGRGGAPRGTRRSAVGQPEG